MYWYLLFLPTSYFAISIEFLGCLLAAILWFNPLCCEFPYLDSCSYGIPGVEFTGLHKDTTAVTQIHFLPGQVSSALANVKKWLRTKLM